MKFAIILAIAASGLFTQSSGAQIINPNSDGGIKGEGFVDYVGHYGEVFKLRGGWQIDPFMRGDIEVISLYPKFRQDLPEGDYRIFKPKATDFEPEKFTRLAMIQLMIIPRTSGTSRSLQDLKKAKIEELDASGVKYKLFEQPHFPAFRGDWPAGSFEINVLSPYRLTQLYTATSSFTCILTAGLDTAPSTYIGDHYGFLRYGLATWIVPQDRATPDDSPAAIVSRGITLHPFSIPVIWLSWAVITGLACLLAGGLRLMDRWNALRRASLALLIFSHAGALLGGAFGLIFWPFAWFSHHAVIPAAIAALLMPILPLFLSKARGLRAERRVLMGVSLWALLAGMLLGYGGSYDWGGGDRTRYLFAYNAILGFVSYAIGGIISGVLDSPEKRSPGKLLLAALMTLLTVSSTRSLFAQDVAAQARAALSARGVTEEGLREEAKKNLKRTRVIYDHQRVELRGILSKGTPDNDSNATFGPLFDLQIAPTHLDDRTHSALPSWIRTPVNVLNDLKSLNEDAYNHLSDAAEEAVRQLANKEVNEIVAHSWGTEIVYNAILAGKIWPPRRLIVAGMPDRDLEKWKALSKFTGTEVIVYSNSIDPIAGAARLGGRVVDAIERTPNMMGDARVVPFPEPRAVFERQWADACAQRTEDNGCNRHQRRAPETIIRNGYKERTHDRIEGYYQAMEDNHDLPMQPPQQRLFPDTRGLPYPGSAPSLQAAQDALVASEASRLYTAALARESRILEAESIGADARFIAGLRNVQTMTPEAKLALTRQAHAEKLAAEQARLASIRAEKEARANYHHRAMEQFDREVRAKKYVQSLAGEACSDPDRMNELAEGHAIIPITDLLPPSMNYSYDSTETSGPGSLNRCQMAVLDMFDAARRRRERVTSVNLAQWAKLYREANPGLFTKIGKAVSGFFGAFGDLLEVPVDRSENSSTGADRPERSEPRTREESNCVYTYIPELNKTVRGCLVY